MQQQPTVSELRAASDEAVAAAQAGLGPLFASHLQTQLLERPQDFVNDQVPLVSSAARARLALLDAEAAETDAATTPAALKRLFERDVSKVLGAQEQFEARVREQLDELRTRVEKGEEAVETLVTREGEKLRVDLTELAKQQHEKSETKLVEKMGAFEGHHLVQVTELQREIKDLRLQLQQLAVICPGGRVEVDPMVLMGKLGLSTTSLTAAKDELARKTELNFSSKGLEADDGRALAGLLASYGNTVDFQKLDLSNSRIGNIGLAALSDTIKSGALDGLQRLVLVNARIGYNGVQSLTKALDEYGTLQMLEINIGGNVLLASGGMCLASLLEKRPEMFARSLESLLLNDCQIGDEAASAVLKHLPAVVKVLSLAGNLLTPSLTNLHGKSFYEFDGRNNNLKLPSYTNTKPCTLADANFSIHSAYEASAATGHVIRLFGATNSEYGPHGSNPYSGGSSIGRAFMHLAGKAAGCIQIGETTTGRCTASTRNGVTSENWYDARDVHMLTELE